MTEHQNPPQPTHMPGTRKGEEMREEEGPETQDTGITQTGRPTGARVPEDATGVNPQGPIDPESPTMPPA